MCICICLKLVSILCKYILDHIIEFLHLVLPDWIVAVCAILAFMQVKKQLAAGTVSNVVSIENEIASKKAKVDAVLSEYKKLSKLKQRTLEENFKRDLRFAMEDWLNVLDSFCYYVLKGYFSDLDLKNQYKGYLNNVISNIEEMNKTYEYNFSYDNIEKLNNNWSSA